MSLGVPMLLAGDEFGHSQGGNNNAYCQDNDISWLDWQNLRPEDEALREFVRFLVHLRRQHRVFSRPRFFRGEVVSEAGLKDITWVTPAGIEATGEDWGNQVAQSLGYVLGGAAGEFFTRGGQRDIDESFLVMMNAYHGDLDFHFPRLSTPLLWEALVDTVEPTGLAKDGRLWKPGESYPLRGHSFALFINRAPADAPIATAQSVGAFAESGDFTGATAHLDHLAELGMTAIELMPIAEFPGRWNWGYDGAQWFAPSSHYGRPEELKALIDTCHGRGIAVLLDVVYNHFGPEGNYLHAIAPDFFTERHHTPWGAAINYAGPRRRAVRDFVLHNALYWLEEFHFDGLRFDAVHAIFDDSVPDIVTELAETIRRHVTEREVHLILENDHNEARRLARKYTAQWNDDVHHAVHVLATGETRGYYGDDAERPIEQ